MQVLLLLAFHKAKIHLKLNKKKNEFFIARNLIKDLITFTGHYNLKTIDIVIFLIKSTWTTHRMTNSQINFYQDTGATIYSLEYSDS